MPIAAPRSKGLRKFIPEADRYAERYGRFTLTRRDIEILELVHRYRYLEARHVRALVGGSGQQITRRLQGLFHQGYLGRYARRERMRLELDPGAPLIAYGLEVRGARALERHRAQSAPASAKDIEAVRWKKEYTRRTEWFLEHHLMVSNFRCTLELALRETPDTELVTWSQGKDTWFRVSIPGGRKRSIHLAPDAYFVLRRGDQVRHFFVEADRSTEEHRRLVQKFAGYWSHLENWRGARPLRANVLLVMTSETRMGNAIESLRTMQKPKLANGAGRGTFWFCIDRHFSIERPTLLISSIWRSVATQGGRLSLHP